MIKPTIKVVVYRDVCLISCDILSDSYNLATAKSYKKPLINLKRLLSVDIYERYI